MAIDNDLVLTEISSESDNDKFTAHNEDNRRIAAGVGGRTTIDMGSDANLTINASDTDGTESWRYRFINITDTGVVLTAGRDIIMPAKGGPWTIENETAQTLTIKITGQTGVALATTAVNTFFYRATAGDIEALP